MKKSQNKDKVSFSSLLVGFIMGMLIMAVGAALLFQSVTGKNVFSKVGFLLGKGKEYIRNFSKEKISNIPIVAVKVKKETEPVDIRLKIDADQEGHLINPMIYGSNLSSKAEFEMDIAKLAKNFGVTNFRFPGGNSLGYRWKKASYDYEDRFDHAPLSNIENIIKFSQIAGGQLVIQVNLESGTAQEAAEWVRYMNKEAGFRVEYWELGNEVYGDWDRAYMTGEEYVAVIKEYVELMRKVDSTIKIGANWGGIKYQEFDVAVARGAFDDIDFVSYHWYPNHINSRHPYKGRTHPLPEEIMANSLAVPKMLERFHQLVAEHSPHRKDKIEFTIMEWDGSWDGTASDLHYEYKGMMWSLANAIFYANSLGEFARNGITVANQFTFQEIMFGFVRGWDIEAGWGGSRWDGKTIRPKGLAFKLLANYFQGHLMSSTLTGSPIYSKEVDWRPDSYSGDVPYVQSFVSKLADDSALTIVLTNQHASDDYTVHISIDGDVRVKPNGETWILNGPNLKSQNDGSPGKVGIKKYTISGISEKFDYVVPAHSVNLLKIPFDAKLKN